MNYNDRYQQWLQTPFIDALTKQELLTLEGNEDEIQDRFYKYLEFGTAGLRGTITQDVIGCINFAVNLELEQIV